MNRITKQSVAILVCASLAAIPASASKDDAPRYKVKYSGGSLDSVKSGQDLRMSISSQQIRLASGKDELAANLDVKSITEVSYGQEVHRRIGTAVGVAIISLGIGAIVAFSKSKKHYIGLTWDGGEGKKGGVALQADKNEYRGLLKALEGVTGKKAVDADDDAKKKDK